MLLKLKLNFIYEILDVVDQNIIVSPLKISRHSTFQKKIKPIQDHIFKKMEECPNVCTVPISMVF